MTVILMQKKLILENILCLKKICFLPGIFLFCLLTSHTVSAFPPDSLGGKMKLPTVSAGIGIMSFIGDAGYSHFNEPLFAKHGFQIEVQKYTDTRISFSIFLLSGKVFGSERSLKRELNFQSGILSEGIQVRYDFISRKNPQQILIPFISAGVEYMVFHPKADLKDENGNYYHYWKDGSIRSLEESDTNASQAVVVHRDYEYETELRDANIDGFGKFSESAIAIPVGIGARLKISQRCSMHFSSVCHFTNTDLMDAVTSESSGSRQGNSKNDKFVYSSVSFRYDLSAQRQFARKTKHRKPKVDVTNVDFDAIAKDDADHDGIPDLEDDAGLNPEQAKTDAAGKPLDSDGDGVPDYRDQEPNSAQDAAVNEKGITITDAMIEEQFRKDSLAYLPPDIVYLKSVDRLSATDTSTFHNKELQNLFSKLTLIPGIYQKLDLDLNGVITADEISRAIDSYLIGKSSYSSEQFYRLIDFFFSQH